MKPPHSRDRSRIILLTVAVVTLLGIGCLLVGGQALKPPAGSRNRAWSESPKNPLIAMGKLANYIVWNDPTVIREGTRYRMWLSGGDARNLRRIVIKVYEATSDDGENWDIKPKPVVSPSDNPMDWDSLRIETPSVVKVGKTYHMYYTGFDEGGAQRGISAIGHATSEDGTNWKKDPANPILSGQTDRPNDWGYGGAGEPGILYNAADQTFYLYYVGLRHPPEKPKLGQVGILLATSRDGSRFTHFADGNGNRKLVLTRDIPGAPNGAWFGFSTPSAAISAGGKFHLFLGFLVAPKGPRSARHVTIAHASGASPYEFQVQEENVFEAGKSDWKDDQVRSPSVLVEGDKFRMWFAGEMKKPHFGAGIGSAVGRIE